MVMMAMEARVCDMTEDELDRFELLWKRRVTLREISKDLGYSLGGLRYYLKADPVRFPPRHKKFDKKKLEELEPRIRAGRMSIADVARVLGVPYETARRHMRKRGLV